MKTINYKSLKHKQMLPMKMLFNGFRSWSTRMYQASSKSTTQQPSQSQNQNIAHKKIPESPPYQGKYHRQEFRTSLCPQVRACQCCLFRPNKRFCRSNCWKGTAKSFKTSLIKYWLKASLKRWKARLPKDNKSLNIWFLKINSESYHSWTTST